MIAAANRNRRADRSSERANARPASPQFWCAASFRPRRQAWLSTSSAAPSTISAPGETCAQRLAPLTQGAPGLKFCLPDPHFGSLGPLDRRLIERSNWKATRPWPRAIEVRAASASPGRIALFARRLPSAVVGAPMRMSGRDDVRGRPAANDSLRGVPRLGPLLRPRGGSVPPPYARWVRRASGSSNGWGSGRIVRPGLAGVTGAPCSSGAF